MLHQPSTSTCLVDEGPGQAVLLGTYATQPPSEVPGFPLKGSFKGDIGLHRAYFW